LFAWGVSLNGTYTGTPTSGWSLSLIESGEPYPGIWVEVGSGSEDGVNVINSTWNSTTNEISAYAAGGWVDLAYYTTGVVGGKLVGTFDPNNTVWQAMALGSGIDTKTFLAMAGTVEGKAKLAQLDIPCVQVGVTDLEGSGAGMSVYMNDITFFAYSTGAAPKIWTTGDVEGTFSSMPSTSTSVSLTSTSGGSITGTFGVNIWESNKWEAAVSGSGNLTRTDITGTVNVNMTGGAAGTYTGDSSGTFSGTGAGVATPHVE
jgi:hypothetical protein